MTLNGHYRSIMKNIFTLPNHLYRYALLDQFCSSAVIAELKRQNQFARVHDYQRAYLIVDGFELRAERRRTVGIRLQLL